MNMKLVAVLIGVVMLSMATGFAPPSYQIALLKYSGVVTGMQILHPFRTW